MSGSSKNANKPWTDADVARLKKLIGENTPTRVIAFKLGRTEGAVYAKAHELGPSLKPTNQSPHSRRKR